MIIQQDPQDFNTQERAEWIGDDWLALQSTNYLEPIEYDNLQDASHYAKRHACPECKALLIAIDSGEVYSIVCPVGHDVTKQTAVTVSQARAAAESELYGQREINASNAPKRTEAEILKDMGF